MVAKVILTADSATGPDLPDPLAGMAIGCEHWLLISGQPVQDGLRLEERGVLHQLERTDRRLPTQNIDCTDDPIGSLQWLANEGALGRRGDGGPMGSDRCGCGEIQLVPTHGRI